MKKKDIVKASVRHMSKVIRTINKNGSKFCLPPMNPGEDGRKFIAWETEDEAFMAGALWAFKKAAVTVEE